MDKQYFFKRLRFNQPDAFKFYNYDSLPETFLAHDKIPIGCHQHGVFYQIAYTHLAGRGCPVCGEQKCADNKALTTDDFIYRSKSKFGDKFDYSKTKYLRQDSVLTIVCPNHGDVSLTPVNHYCSKHGCPKCDFEIPKAIKKKKVLDKAKEIHDNKYDYSKVIFVNVTQKVEIICPVHGSFWQSLYDHTAKRTICPHCSREKDKLSFEDFVLKSRAIHGNKYDYSKVKYNSVADPIIITCKLHGDFTQRAASHLAGNKCKKCFLEENKLSTNEFIKNAKVIHGNNYDYSKVKYLGNKTPVEIICSIHGSFWQKPNTHVSGGNGCTFCYESKGERAVEAFLKKYGINFIREYRIKPHLFRYDFYLPDFNIYIEFNGIQHYKPVNNFGGLQGYLDTKKRDNIKKILVEQTGGTLVILKYLNLINGSVDKEIVRKLKSLYLHWFSSGSEIRVFKTSQEVYRNFNISPLTPVRNLISEVEKTTIFRILF